MGKQNKKETMLSVIAIILIAIGVCHLMYALFFLLTWKKVKIGNNIEKQEKKLV